jgi:hypothetical protein
VAVLGDWFGFRVGKREKIEDGGTPSPISACGLTTIRILSALCGKALSNPGAGAALARQPCRALTYA